MKQSILKTPLILLATGALVTGGLVAPALADDTAGHGEHSSYRQTVDVVGNGKTVTIDDDSIEAGKVRFEVSSTNAVTAMGGGSAITLFKLNEDKTKDDFFAALKDQFSEDAKTRAASTTALKETATFRGLADVVPDHPERVTEYLDGGTYWLMDLSSPDASMTQPPELTELTVRGDADTDGPLWADVDVTTEHDRFYAPDTWPADGSYTFTNDDDTIHFMAISPVKQGTTDEDVQKYFDSGAMTPPDFAVEGPSFGNDVVSPGYSLKVRYDMPAGTYVLLCFVSDEETGMPHAFMGMHKVVVLE